MEVEEDEEGMEVEEEGPEVEEEGAEMETAEDGVPPPLSAANLAAFRLSLNALDLAFCLALSRLSSALSSIRLAFIFAK